MLITSLTNITPVIPFPKHHTGTVKVKLYKGNVIVMGRKSSFSLYDKVIASFEDDKGLYNQVRLVCLRFLSVSFVCFSGCSCASCLSVCGGFGTSSASQ